MKLAKQNSHERDKLIVFDEEPHIYSVNAVDYDISVTGFVHKFFSEFNSQEIIDKFYDRWQSTKDSKYFGMSKQDILDSWEKNRIKQADAGTFLHNCIELFYNDEEHNNDTKEYKFFLDFYKDHNHLQPYRTEWMVFDEDLALAGSIDMCFINDDGTVSIYDWKRSKEIKKENVYQRGLYPLSHLPDTNYWHYSLQLNIYKYFLEKNYGLKVKDMYLVVLHPTNLGYMKLEVVNLEKEVEEMFKLRKGIVNL